MEGTVANKKKFEKREVEKIKKLNGGKKNKMNLTNYSGKYIGLRLSCGSTGFGKLEIKMKKETFSLLGKQSEVSIPDQYFLTEAWLPSEGSITGLLEDYLGAKKRGAVKKTHTFEIEPNHVTAIRDISEKVEKALAKEE